MDPTLISGAIMTLVGLGAALTAYLTTSDKKRRARLRKLDDQNVDLFGYVYDLRRVIVSNLGRKALPVPPDSLHLDSKDSDG